MRKLPTVRKPAPKPRVAAPPTPAPASRVEPAAAATAEKKPRGRPQVYAGDCPRSPLHRATRVYKTQGEVRYCVCDDCGNTWKRTGPPASPPATAEGS